MLYLFLMKFTFLYIWMQIERFIFQKKNQQKQKRNETTLGLLNVN